MTRVLIRPARSEDATALYGVCLRTAADGDDGSDAFADRALPGEVWVGPYLRLEPDLAFVLDDGDVPVGYVLGALDTASFEARCEAGWWPALRRRYPLDAFPASSADAALVHRIHGPPTTPADVTAEHPSHLHVDLLPAAQGQGQGRRLLETLFDALRSAGSPGVHLGVSLANERAIGFYRRLSLVELRAEPDAVWMGRPLR